MHSENTIAAITAGFPTSLRTEVTEVMERISPADHEPIAEPAFEVMTAEASVKVPCRVYFPEITTLSNLTPLQSGLLAAIMSRHHSGYQRQTWLRQLLNFPTTWGVPYLTAAVGEYVIEILITLD